MGLLDNVRKNLGFGGKGAEEKREAAPVGRTAEDQAVEDAAAVEVKASDQDAAEAAAAQATRQQAAADAAAAQEAANEGLDPEAPEVRPQAEEAAAEAAAGTGQPGPVAPRVTEVVVEQGDTMSGIAAQYGVDLGPLIATNADTVPNPDRIYPGQVLRLP
ncbi:LysM domain-containing protein [Arthrobacter sp. ISL-95]|uniref:LysM peptidoglycan-binding domain-containing protein n=1 Tax=Arthrobacter sp. ISL-95 TaxID=2819116 RepID=UPI001BE84A8A|nr:LysM domain-containing protein [Arthrobacter sp. ISL-95]MBT2585770.1 LysM peptidoglycan-binding domain-containing protein [Arthrobacter sp. ISL-95]